MQERRHGLGRITGALLAGLIVAGACTSGGDTATDPTGEPEVEGLRLHQLQVLGSHNSYHLAPEPVVLDALAGFAPDLARELDYGHASLTEQLDRYGVRQFELDVYADPDGGRFADRPALALVGEPTASGDPVLDEPGFKVLHLVDVDFRSSCPTLVACLAEIETWSSANPDHLPVTVMIETKQTDLVTSAAAAGVEGVDDLGVELTPVLAMDRALFDALEAEVLSVFDRERIITPDEVRGDASSLEEAVLAGDAWPAVEEARGRLLFALVDTGATRDVYVGDAPSLEDRLLFTSSEPGRDDAAFLRVDDPVADRARLTELVEAGYLVRTRADTPGVEANAGDTTRRDAALASGAHFVSTDHYVADPELGTGYVVEVRDPCNPVTAPPGCDLG